jgi:starvation-inducible outer membrane lipoprotein
MLTNFNKTPYLILFSVLLLQACSSAPQRYNIAQDHGPANSVDLSHVKDAVPKVEPRSKYGFMVIVLPAEKPTTCMP